MARNLDIAALRSLIAVADTEGVTKAASQINLTQSAVSMQIKRLETTFGAKLLHREGRGVALTSVGEQLVSYARRLISLNDETWWRLTNDDYEGEIILGVPEDIVNPHIPLILKRSTELYPRIHVQLEASLTKTLKQRFKEGSIDLIVTTEKRAHKGAETIQRATHNWYGALNGKAHLRRPLPLAMCQYCAQKQEVTDTLDKVGIPWKVVGQYNSDTAVDAMLSADLAVVPKIGHPVHANHVLLPTDELPALEDVLVNMYLATHRDSRLIDKIAGIVREAFQSDSGLAAVG